MWIKDIKKAPRMISVQALGGITALQVGYPIVEKLIADPAVLHAIFPPEWVQVITGVLALIGLVGRLVVQPGLQQVKE